MRCLKIEAAERTACRTVEGMAQATLVELQIDGDSKEKGSPLKDNCRQE